jgi:hypothetical protein
MTMKRAVKAMAAVDVVLALVITVLLLFSDGARERFRDLFGGGGGEAIAVPAAGQSGSGDQSGQADSAEDAARKQKKGEVTKLDEPALKAMLASGRVDEAEVDRRVTEIVKMKKHTIEVKRTEEERRIGEVVDWFDHLMAHHPESGRKAREIMNEYIELRYNTYGDMADVDPEFARGQRESIRQRVGQRLMSELPPAQGATVMKQLFI